MPVVSKENIEAKNGRDLLTTIDVDMQDIVESELRKQILDKNATCGTAVIMEVKTGEIRAISNLTRYGSTVRDDENHAVTMRCEPGSTFKLVSLMALIDEAGYGLDYPVDCTENGRYYYQVGRRKYLVQDSHAVGQTDLLGVMEHSSNIGFVKVIDEEYHDSPERFVDFIHSLGIDRQVNMQLNGGLKPIIKDPRRKKET
ncbi:MAG: penicillin-binding transpeptidase domain-containing protein, partial [Alistipes inops]